MNKSDALELIKLLSALESWSFTVDKRIPDYLNERLGEMVVVLERIVLEPNTIGYNYANEEFNKAMNKEKNT